MRIAVNSVASFVTQSNNVMGEMSFKPHIRQKASKANLFLIYGKQLIKAKDDA